MWKGKIEALLSSYLIGWKRLNRNFNKNQFLIFVALGDFWLGYRCSHSK